MKRLLFILAVLPAFYTAQIITFVSGGQEVDIREVPHQVSLQIFGSNNCGGSIVGNKWILTAAHCVDEAEKVAYMRVKTGIAKLNTPISTTREYKIKQIILHPNYNDNTLHNDIALLELTQDIEFNSNTQPIHLADSDELYSIGRNTKVSGWGYSNPGIPVGSNELRIVEAPIMSNNDAQQYYSSPISSNMIATHPVSDSNRKGACQGDSGGALIATDNNGITKQIGIACATTPFCIGGLRSPSIYTKVANYIDWIKQYVPIGIKIQGTSVMCGGDTETYTVDNPNGDPITWQLSNNIEEVSRAGNSITIRAKSGFNGLATIKASNGTIEVSQKVWVGKPKVKIVEAHQPHAFVAHIESTDDNATIEEQGLEIEWENYDREIVKGDSYSKLKDKTFDGVTATIKNICGTVSIRKIFTFEDTGFIINSKNEPNLYELSEKPSQRTAMRSRSVEDNIITIQVANATGQVVLTTQSKTFSLANALPGTYYARVMKNGQVVHTQTLIKR